MNMIYLMRHGEISGSIGRHYIGQTDSPLSKLGRLQAGYWGEKLAGAGIVSVYSSDLIRSSVFAEIIAKDLQTRMQVEPDLREISLGDWDGQFMQEIRSEFPTAYAERGERINTFRPPGGESFEDLYQRVVPVFEDIAGSTSGSVLIAGHAGVNRMILCRVLGMPIRNLFSIRQDYGALNLIDNSGNALQVAGMNIRPGNIKKQILSGTDFTDAWI